MLPKTPPDPKPPHDDPAESERFIDMARELGVDETDESFDKAFKKFISSPLVAPNHKGKSAS
jgi:hypothetical protein